MFDRPMFQERLAESTSRCVWGTLLIAGGVGGLFSGLIAVWLTQASTTAAIVVLAVFLPIALTGVVVVVSGRRSWRLASTLLGFGQATDFACSWTDPVIAFDPKGWADLTAEGGCVYCAETTPGATRTVSQPIRSARAEQSRSWRHALFGVLGALTVDGRDLTGREAAGLSRDAKGVRLHYVECVPCDSARPHTGWLWGAFVGALGLGIAGIALAATHALGPAIGAAGWAYAALVGLPLSAAIGLLIAACVARAYGNPVHLAKADVNDGILIRLPQHLAVRAGAPTPAPPVRPPG
jgi:hypothetical protein